MRKLDISVLQQYAVSKGGKLISTEYVDNRFKYTWECDRKHKWVSVYNGKSWCPHCASTSKPDIEDLQIVAHNKGGKLLSDKYETSITKYRWECKNEHQWLASWNVIHRGSWCPMCETARNRKPDISVLQEYARSKGGELLSKEYINAHTKCKWQCSEGHIWEMRFNDVNQNHWCPKCFFDSLKIDINEITLLAEQKGGKLVSLEYKKGRSIPIWKCSEGHTWSARLDGIKTGGWCPECASFKHEKLCRNLIEEKLKLVLPKKRVYYDENNKKKFYEFDGYNKEHKIAFEYQGIQHYEYPNHFQKTLEKHLSQRQRDKDKIQYCIDNGIKLIIIPHTENKRLSSYIDLLLEKVLV